MPHSNDPNDAGRTEEEIELLEAFHALSEEDRAAALRVAEYLAHRPKDEPMTLEIMEALWEAARKPQ